MDIVVDEVLVLREETGLCRRSIIRSKNRGEGGVLFEVVGNDLQSLGRDRNIGINKDYYFAASLFDAQIARTRRSKLAWCVQVGRTVGTYDFRRIIGGAIIHHQNFKVAES